MGWFAAKILRPIKSLTRLLTEQIHGRFTRCSARPLKSVRRKDARSASGLYRSFHQFHDSVQHVSVSNGGQAVVAGQLQTGPKGVNGGED
jgi:hypothetical protein